MQSFYPGDLVQWIGCPWSQHRGSAWRVVAYHDLLPPVRGERAMPEETYRIIPSNGSSREQQTVGRMRLVRWTANERAFEPGDRLIYAPSRYRAEAEDEPIRRAIAEHWVAEVQSSYMSDHAPGDIIVKFAARSPLAAAVNDWNAIRWREDFRIATHKEIRECRDRYETAAQAIERITRESRTPSLNPFDELLADRVAAEEVARAAQLAHLAQTTPAVAEVARAILGVDLASGPDQSVMAVLRAGVPTVLDKLIASAPAKPPKPEPARVIGGRRKLDV